MAEVDTSANVTHRTPAEFTEAYVESLQDELGVYDVQANKVGFLGFQMNVLGQISYDNKNYFDSLFKEAFPATASLDDNLYLHGSIYGYNGELSIPAMATGYLEFDMDAIPVMPDTAEKREVFLGTTDTFITVDVEGITFTSAARYTFSYNRSAYQITINRADGSIENIPSPSSLIEVEAKDFVQELIDVTEFTIPNYTYGSFYTYQIDLEDDEAISNIDVQVKELYSENWDTYEVKRVKYLDTASSNSVFFKKTNTDQYQLEFGSGIRGKWVPGATARIVIHKTVGSAGNMGASTTGTINEPIQAVVIDHFPDGSSTSQTIEVAKQFIFHFEYSENGSDSVQGEALRDSVVKFIQSRDNFISEGDYNNIESKYLRDFRFQFKKTEIQENVFYLLRAFRDSYQQIVYSTNHSPLVLDNPVQGVILNSKTEDEPLSLLPMKQEIRYQIIYKDQLGAKIFSNKISIFAENYPVSVELSWTGIHGAAHCYVVREFDEDTNGAVYMEITDGKQLEFKDIGSNGNFVSVRENNPTLLNEDVGILFPEFMIDGKRFVSPFYYTYDKNFRWYDGHIFYPLFVQSFSSYTTISNYQGTIIPSIILAIVYEPLLKRTRLMVHSYQDISSWNFDISSKELGVPLTAMINKNELDRVWYYTDNDGIILDEFSITVRGYFEGYTIFEARTDLMTQTKNISDILRLVSYGSGGNNYLLCVPVLEADVFESDQRYFIDKIYNFIGEYNYSENRMVSDNIQSRFLNTYQIRTGLLENCVYQGTGIFARDNVVEVRPLGFINVPEELPKDGDAWIVGGSYMNEEGIRTDVGPSFDVYATYSTNDILRLYGTFPWGSTDPFELDESFFIEVPLEFQKFVSVGERIRIKLSNVPDNNKLLTIRSMHEVQDSVFVEVNERIEYSSNSGVVSYIDYDTWKNGYPDCIVQWDQENNRWVFTELNNYDVVSIRNTRKSYVYIDGIFYEYVLQLPLKLTLKLAVDKNAVIEYSINLSDEEDQIKLDLSKLLQESEFSGTEVVYYPSKIIDFIQSYRKVWIKGIVVTATDSSTPPLVLADGLETLSEDQVRHNLAGDKLELTKYTSPYIWWDVDNIKVIFEVY